MQSLPIYLYPNTITVTIDLDPSTPGVNNLMYQRDLTIQKGVKNKIRVQIKNSDQKSLPISNTSTYIFSMFDAINNQMLIEKPLRILDDSIIVTPSSDQPQTGYTLNFDDTTGIVIGQTAYGFGIAANSIVTGISTTTVTLNNLTIYPVTSSTSVTFGTLALRGAAELVFSEGDTLNLDVSDYAFSIKYADPIWGGYFPVYSNTYYGITGKISLRDDIYPVLQPSQEVTGFNRTFNTDNNLYYFPSGNLYAYPEYHSNNIALHTMAFYMTNYIGTVTIQGTLSNQPDSVNTYSTITTLTYNGFSGIDYVNFNGIYSYVRVFYTPAISPGDSTNDRPAYYGSFDKLLYRS
jgi:hypothetical protein